MAQTYSSKHTSVNSKQLPAIYKRIDFTQLYYDIIARSPVKYYGAPLILDYGSGRSTKHIREYVASFGFRYVGYDPYWNPGQVMPKLPDVVICSNVLNVIDNSIEMRRVHNLIRNMSVPYFITVYEGNKSGIGCETKKDCYQRNKKVKDYLMCSETIKRKVITHPGYIKYIKKGKA